MADDRYAALTQAPVERAVEFVETGIVVGLGTGSPAILATRRSGV